MTLFLSHAIPSRAHTPTVINFSHQLSIKLDNFNIIEENVIVGKEKSTLFKQYLIYTQQELVQRSTTQITYRSWQREKRCRREKIRRGWNIGCYKEGLAHNLRMVLLLTCQFHVSKQIFGPMCVSFLKMQYELSSLTLQVVRTGLSTTNIILIPGRDHRRELKFIRFQRQRKIRQCWCCLHDSAINITKSPNYRIRWLRLLTKQFGNDSKEKFTC